MPVSSNGRSVGAPVFNNDTLDADKELHLYILVKSGLQVGVATASVIMGSTTLPDLGRRIFWTTLQALFEVGIVSLNRQVVNVAWDIPNAGSNNYMYVPSYDIFVGAPLHIIDIGLSALVSVDIPEIPPVPQVVNMVVNPLVVQPIAQNIVALPPPLHLGVPLIDVAYGLLYVGGSIGLGIGQIIKNGIDMTDLPRGREGLKPYNPTPSVPTQQNN
jgi:hypothetical protein